MSKYHFNVFANDGDKKEQVTFRIFKEGGTYEDIIADYRVSGVGDTPPVGGGIKSKSKAGNPIIRLNIGVGEPRHYYRGTLVLGEEAIKAIKSGIEQPKGERPGVFGTVTDKAGTEMEVACWVRRSKNGKPYLSCVLQDPFKKGEEGEEEPAAAASGTDDDEIPF